MVCFPSGARVLSQIESGAARMYHFSGNPFGKDVSLIFPGEVFRILVSHIEPRLITDVVIEGSCRVFREFMHGHVSPVNLATITADVSNPSGNFGGYIIRE
jgi:hypothetical protein